MGIEGAFWRLLAVFLFTWCIRISLFYAESPNLIPIIYSENNSSEKFRTYFDKTFTTASNYIISTASTYQITHGNKNVTKKSQLPKAALIYAPSASNKKHTICVDNPVHWLDDWIGSTRWETSQVFKNCPVSNCVFSKNSTCMDSADVVIFRAASGTRCRKKIKQGQIWVIMEHEAPFSYGKFQDCYRNVFNWTMTYRRDSDFTLVHGQFSESSGYDGNKLSSLIKSKKNAIVGFISHCTTTAKRSEYIKKLRSYGIEIDVYGYCGKHSCRPDGNIWKTVWNSTSRIKDKHNCFDVLDSHYKFYLSFENSLCTDYVTEKSFHLILRHNIVPIIRDASNHTLFHPPKSYIHTSDFKNISSLAAHLKQLFVDIDEYKTYYNWRKHYSSETISGILQTEFCNMCQRLQSPLKYQRIYSDLNKFLRTSDTETPICHNVIDI